MKKSTVMFVLLLAISLFCRLAQADDPKPLISCDKTEAEVNEPFYISWYAPEADWCVLWERYNDGESVSLGFVDKDGGNYKLQRSDPGSYSYYFASLKDGGEWEFSDSVSVYVSADRQDDNGSDMVFYCSKAEVERNQPVCLSWYVPEADWCVLWEKFNDNDYVSLGFVDQNVSQYIVQHADPGIYTYCLATMKNDEDWKFSQTIPVLVADHDDDKKCEYLRQKGMNNTWNMLFMVYRNVDIGSFHSSFSDSHIASVKRVASELKYTLEGLSDGRMGIGTVDVVVVDDPVTSASKESGWGAPPALTYGKDGDVDFTYILDHKDINLVCVVVPLLGLGGDGGWGGLGGPEITFKGRRYYTIICNYIPISDVRHECDGKYYLDDGLLFVHEILHAVETNSRNVGCTVFEELHSGDINGYGNGHYGWYRPLMTNTLNNGKTGFLKQSYYVGHRSIPENMRNGLHTDYDGVQRYYVNGLPVATKGIDLILPSTLTSVDAEAFQGTQAHSVLVPPAVQFIAPDAFPAGVTIYGESGTYAETWANQNGHPFINIQ